MSRSPVIPTDVVLSIARLPASPRSVAGEFKQLINQGARLDIAGSARRQPADLFARGLLPKHKIQLFDWDFYLTNVRQIPELRFYVAYLVNRNLQGRTTIYPRILYKDLSLVWRSASHFSYDGDKNIWVGKGDTRDEWEDGEEVVVSVESTTDLPLEMQSVLEDLLRWTRKPLGSESIIGLILRRAPAARVEPYEDFLRPRRLAVANPANRIHGGQAIAWFRKPNDPTSLKFASGFAPDFKNGVLERRQFNSRLYHGRIERFRILSANRQIQYGFIAGPKHAWIIPPQATTTQLSSYGVRTVDVVADDDLFIPGYEYHHFEDDDELVLYSQIPPGFVGPPCPFDDAKADASPWLDRLPVIQDFRRAFE